METCLRVLPWIILLIFCVRSITQEKRIKRLEKKIFDEEDVNGVESARLDIRPMRDELNDYIDKEVC